MPDIETQNTEQGAPADTAVATPTPEVAPVAPKGKRKSASAETPSVEEGDPLDEALNAPVEGDENAPVENTGAYKGPTLQDFADAQAAYFGRPQHKHTPV